MPGCLSNAQAMTHCSQKPSIYAGVTDQALRCWRCCARILAIYAHLLSGGEGRVASMRLVFAATCAFIPLLDEDICLLAILLTFWKADICRQPTHAPAYGPKSPNSSSCVQASSPHLGLHAVSFQKPLWTQLLNPSSDPRQTGHDFVQTRRLWLIHKPSSFSQKHSFLYLHDKIAALLLFSSSAQPTHCTSLISGWLLPWSQNSAQSPTLNRVPTSLS